MKKVKRKANARCIAHGLSNVGRARRRGWQGLCGGGVKEEEMSISVIMSTITLK